MAFTEKQDLGDDFHFEQDPFALASILNEEGISRQLEPKAFGSCLTPATKLPKQMANLQDRFDFFEGRNGMVFFRPSAKFSNSAKKSDSNSKGTSESASFRGMKRGLRVDIKPKRMGTTTAQNQQRQAPFKRPLQPKSLNHAPHTEKKLVPFFPPPHR